MHPIRVETVDTVALTHTLEHGENSAPVTYPLLWAERTPFGLHVGRAFIDHSRIRFMERHIVPDPGLLVNRFTGTSQTAHSQYYVDVASIARNEACWITRDLYLDFAIGSDGIAVVLDTDEYVAAMQQGLLDIHEATRALTALHRLVNGVLACGSLDAWLAREGISLHWRGMPTSAVGREDDAVDV